MLELKNICYTVSTPETGEQTILKDISVTIPDGKLIVFTGPNGGGKTNGPGLVAHLSRLRPAGVCAFQVDALYGVKKSVCSHFQSKAGAYGCFAVFMKWITGPAARRR